MFTETMPLNMFLNIVLLTRRVRQALVDHPQIGHVNVDDWVYHVSTVAAMLMTKKTRPSPKDLANTNLHNIDLARINDLVPVVAREYERRKRDKYVPFSVMAKNKDVSVALVKRCESMLQSSRWRRWPEEAMTDDAVILQSDVFYRGPRRA
jgi:hypothetical protein